MRIRLAALSVLVILAASCGSGGSDSAGTTNTTEAGKTATTGSNNSEKVDCAALKVAGQQLLSVQFLAQLRNPAIIERLKAGTIGNLDLDKFLAAMETFHALDGYESPLGDPKEAIDFYETAARSAQELFAADPPTQAAIDKYNTAIGSTASFIGRQTAIAGALDEAGC